MEEKTEPAAAPTPTQPQMDPTGRGLTQAGKICGIVGIAIQAVVLVLQLLGAGLLSLIGISQMPQ